MHHPVNPTVQCPFAGVYNNNNTAFISAPYLVIMTIQRRIIHIKQLHIINNIMIKIPTVKIAR